MNLMQSVKSYLVSLGPKHPWVHRSLAVYARIHGDRVHFKNAQAHIDRRDHTLIFSDRDFILIPFMMKMFDSYFETIEPQSLAGRTVLDFSEPATQRYRKTGLELMFPGVPEDDSIEAYTYRFPPREGMTVFDVGAHAGLTTYQFSKLVGDQGTVYAFEPDDGSRAILEKNIAHHHLDNVSVHEVALAAKTGRALFNMDGSVAAGLVEFLVYPDTGARKEVATMTIPDFCAKIGRTPDLIKMDIEGAEIAVVEGALDFLRQNPIHFAIESYHRDMEGALSYVALEKLFRSIGYDVESSDKFGQMFTWAAPPSQAR